MLFDWFTVLAQVFNFLLLVWLLRRFLYRPVLNAIDEREKRISRELSEAETKKSEALKASREYQSKNDEFEAQRAKLWSQALEDANNERRRILEETLKEATILSSKRQQVLKNEEHQLLHEIKQRTQQEVFAISRKTIKDLAGANLEEKVGDVFIRRLREMDPPTRDRLSGAFQAAPDQAVIRSVFDLPERTRAQIKSALEETFSMSIKVNYETAPELIGGIELSINGQKLGWNISEYLASLEKSLDEVLKDQVAQIEKVNLSGT